MRELPPKVGRPPAKPLQLLYIGTIGKKQGLLELCRRMRLLEFDYHFTIRGGGGEADSVRDWVRTSGDRRFDFAGLLPESEFVEALHRADWCVISERPGAGFSFLPSEVIPSVCAGTPVLAICDGTGPLGREVKRSEAGRAIEWTQLDTLSDLWKAYEHRPETFAKLQANCRRYARTQERSHALQRVERILLENVAVDFRRRQADKARLREVQELDERSR